MPNQQSENLNSHPASQSLLQACRKGEPTTAVISFPSLEDTNKAQAIAWVLKTTTRTASDWCITQANTWSKVPNHRDYNHWQRAKWCAPHVMATKCRQYAFKILFDLSVNPRKSVIIGPVCYQEPPKLLLIASFVVEIRRILWFTQIGLHHSYLGFCIDTAYF